MAIYDHRCGECGPIVVETETISEYLEFKEEYGVAKGGNVQVPCPKCGNMAPRDWSAGSAPFKIKGGSLYKTKEYGNDAKKNWYKEEINNTKEVLKFKKGINPYSNMSLDTPEDLGFKRVSDGEAENRSRRSLETLGDTKATVDNEIAKSKV